MHVELAAGPEDTVVTGDSVPTLALHPGPVNQGRLPHFEKLEAVPLQDTGGARKTPPIREEEVEVAQPAQAVVRQKEEKAQTLDGHDAFFDLSEEGQGPGEPLYDPVPTAVEVQTDRLFFQGGQEPSGYLGGKAGQIGPKGREDLVQARQAPDDGEVERGPGDEEVRRQGKVGLGGIRPAQEND